MIKNLKDEITENNNHVDVAGRCGVAFLLSLGAATFFIYCLMNWQLIPLNIHPFNYFCLTAVSILLATTFLGGLIYSLSRNNS